MRYDEVQLMQCSAMENSTFSDMFINHESKDIKLLFKLLTSQNIRIITFCFTFEST